MVGGEWLALRFGRFTPGLRAPGTHWIGGRVAPRIFLDDAERKNILLFWDLNHDPSDIYPVASSYTDCVIRALAFCLGTVLILALHLHLGFQNFNFFRM
jgi:hypothetical protein